jgi:3-phytase
VSAKQLESEMKRRNRIVALLAGSTALLATPSSATELQTSSTKAVSAAAETQPTGQGGAGRAVVASDDASPQTMRIVGTAELEGLEIYALGGRRIGKVAAGEAVGVDTRDDFQIAGRTASLLAAADATTNGLRFFAWSDAQLRDISARAVPLGFAVESLCLYRSVMDGATYAFAVGDGGEIDQWMLFTTDKGQVDARQVRRINVPSTAEHCVADDRTGQLYVSEQAVGLWRFNADAETDSAPVLVDAPRLGRIDEEVGGVALYDGGEGARWLIASDASASQLNVYDRGKDDSFVGAVGVTSSAGVPVEEPGGLYSTGNVAGMPGAGLLLVADEDAAGGSNYKIVPFDRVASALGLATGTPQSGALPSPPFPTIHARFETRPAPSSGDAADDPAIWADASNPSRSLIIGTDKKSGLDLYDMQGKLVQHLPDGKMNNVDLRGGFMLGGKPVVLVTASDRTRKAIAIYALDTANRRLVDVADGLQPSGLSDPYGLCMYRSARTNKHYVFVSDPDGLVRQWELVPTRAGKVRARAVRDLHFKSQTEGCVADDETGILYVAEEDVGLWSTGAEPRPGSAIRSVAAIAANPKLKDDMEGVGLYDLGGGRGYLVVSSQGNNSYAVFRREGDQAYLGSFAVVADGARGIDGVSETDGLEVTSANLGLGFEHGAMVAQDGRNVLPSENQNFKAVSWTDIATALKLEVRQ